jgi:NAD(P)-dependent dehydrogenase (short-subunit alcohol dehydrogenase family)
VIESGREGGRQSTGSAQLNSQGTIVVTGASSGIGEACVRRMAAAGYEVFAGVRRDEDAERLRADRVVPLMLDVTDAGQIAAAARIVGEAVGERGLAGLVNNAGIAVPAPVEFVPMDAFRRQIDVNFIGQVAVTQAFVPLLRAARGRIVNISSIGGRIALPLIGGYAASKFALEGLSDSLRRELRPWGIHVAVMEPGTIATPIWEKSVAEGDALLAQAGPEAQRLYGPLLATLRTASAQGAANGLAPDVVAKDVEHALTARRPRTRYLCGREAKARVRIAALLPDRAMDGLVARAMKARASA